MLIAQITDTHLFADADQQLKGMATAASLAAVLQQVAQLQSPPEVLLLTGDLSQDETPESYQRLRDLVAPLHIPAYWLPGNHDQPALMEAWLHEPPLSSAKQFEADGWMVVLLDSILPGRVEGWVTAETLAWLEAALAAAGDRPVLVALHHPPMSIGSAWMDEMDLQNPEDLFAVIDRYPTVKLVIFGHIHQAFEAERNGVWYFGCPSTSVQFKPLSREFAVGEEMPGFRLIELLPDGQFATQVVRVPFAVEPVATPVESGAS